MFRKWSFGFSKINSLWEYVLDSKNPSHILEGTFIMIKRKVIEKIKNDSDFAFCFNVEMYG